MKTDQLPEPVRVLFLCTQNSARSQMAEALLARKGRARFVAACARDLSDPPRRYGHRALVRAGPCNTGERAG